MGKAVIDGSNGEICIRYDGGEAADHMLDMSAVGQSMQGMAKILSTVGTVLITERYSPHSSAQVVRPRLVTAEANCLTLHAAWTFVTQQQIFSGISGAALTALITWLFSRNSQNTQEMKHLSDALNKSIEALASGDRERTDRFLDTINRMADGLRPSLKQAVEPIGRYCSSMTINSSTVIDEDMAREIRESAPEDLTSIQTYDVHITEFDVENRTAKIRIVGDDSRRLPATISDPSAQLPANIYLKALASGDILRVSAKAALKEDAIKHLYVFDAALPIIPS